MQSNTIIKFITTIFVGLAIFLGTSITYNTFLNTNTNLKSKIYITGNIHGDLDLEKLSLEKFKAASELTKNDYLIILGDFGLIWNNSIEDDLILDKLNEYPCSILFVDGTHENFNLLKEYPEIDFLGGKAAKIRENIYHLKRGEIFNISGKKFLVLGGGFSHDKEFRELNVTYWKEEEVSNDEWNKAIHNLKSNNFVIDYILTHTPPQSDLKEIEKHIDEPINYTNELSNKLEYFKDTVKYKKWFHGYYHIDLDINSKQRNIFNDIVKIK